MMTLFRNKLACFSSLESKTFEGVRQKQDFETENACVFRNIVQTYTCLRKRMKKSRASTK